MNLDERADSDFANLSDSFTLIIAPQSTNTETIVMQIQNTVGTRSTGASSTQTKFIFYDVVIDPGFAYGDQVYDADGPAEEFKFARHANKLVEYGSVTAPEIKVSTHTVYVE